MAESQKRKRSASNIEKSDSDFADRKNRVKLSHDQDSNVNKVFKEWLPNKDMARVMKKCFPLAKGATVPRTLDSWAFGLLEKSSRLKVENEDKRLVKLSKKLHLATGPLFKAWSLSEEADQQEVAKHIKKSVLAMGQLQLAINHERRMNCYGEICRDLGKARDHLKEGSTAFGKAAKKQEKPPLFGDKFRHAVFDRGTISKELKEAKRQFEQSTPKSKPAFQSVAKGSTRYVSPLQKVYQGDQSTSSYQNQSFRKDLPKKPSGRGRGSRYVSTNCTNLHFSQAFLHCTDVGSARSAGVDFAARINFYLVNHRRGISGDGGSTRIPGSELHKVHGPTFCGRQSQVFPKEFGIGKSLHKILGS